MTEAKTYKDTVNLPQTGFDMRANAAKREPEIQKFWEERRIFETVSQENPGEPFILHDGPPYANGSLHLGHALNKILKDIINRYQLLRGRKVRYVPGWDCHGLPIELKVLQNLKSKERQALTPLTLRQKAREFALKAVDEQRESFKRYGVWGDWDNPYLTLTPEYEAAQIGVFGEMALKGYIYRGLKPVHWSPSSQTALAEAELEYPEGHTSPSIYVAFPVVGTQPTQTKLAEYLPYLHVAIWTTTPWTLPANLAVSVNPDLTYAVVEAGLEFEPAAGKFLLVAAEAVERLAATWGTELTVLTTIAGKDLEHCTYRHPLFDRTSEIVIGGDYVTTESGTGLVHTAPGHGLEDYQVGLRYGLPILSPVDAKGNFTEEAGQFAGLNVLKDANDAIIQALQAGGFLLKREPYLHKYPYDWRTKKPTIFRATEQWFASVEGFRDAALRAISQVQWIPAQGENRITSMVQERSDWCISRQRSWGVPIPVFYDEETNEPLLNKETIDRVRSIIAEKGSDAWWELSVEELLPESYRNNGRTYRKGTDTMDVWFDSGSSWSAVALERGLGYPVDVYLEGSDQHRGWFQSSLLTSVATNGIAPYKTVLTHGFTLDEKGYKMSKSLGNTVDPAVVINGGKNAKQEPAYGADVLRLWVSSVDYSADVPLGQTILKQMADVYRKIRNTARFLLGNLHDFNPAEHAVFYEDMPELDRYMLHRMTEVFAEVTEAFDTYQFFRFFQTVQNFCVVDLSNFYLDIAKDRLYISAENAQRRRSCQTVLAIALENLARAIAPVLCHMAEDIWQNIPYETPCESVFQAGWVQVGDYWKNPELAKKWETLRFYRSEVNKVLEKARTNKAIGSSLDAKILLYVSDPEQRSILENLNSTHNS
ncbi:MAG TPA: isoleucine--tRNA ligase [Oscillatoriales cyanobacterium M59_W2019_021]|nr:MAG: isoleucine--tRNA ligase [Cyanobacteria bacterium J055]HIK31664.1 isoleucine--tRNA ligase [Oscillatoriales cyanobacterium M4454_W2019_049]HIK50363.1 isoleucine--tRNA ligase [Oscillatoriales cyanobacterium M59_W2019_021]